MSERMAWGVGMAPFIAASPSQCSGAPAGISVTVDIGVRGQISRGDALLLAGEMVFCIVVLLVLVMELRRFAGVKGGVGGQIGAAAAAFVRRYRRSETPSSPASKHPPTRRTHHNASQKNQTAQCCGRTCGCGL